jgi:hypothetical protein
MSGRFGRVRDMSTSLIGRLGSSTFRLSAAAVSTSLTSSCFSSESALRPFHHGIRGRGEQSFGRPCRQTNGRSKRTCELTSSIVPRAMLRKAWPASSHPHSVIFYRCDRFRRIDTWSTSAQIPLRLTWIYESEQARRASAKRARTEFQFTSASRRSS